MGDPIVSEQHPAGAQAGSSQQAPSAQSPGVGNGAENAEQERLSRRKIEEGLEHHKTRADAAEAELRKYREKEAKAEEERLKQKGEWEKLYAQEKAAREATEQKTARILKRAALQDELRALDVKYAPQVLDIAPYDSLELEGESVKNVKDVAKAWVEGNPLLFHKNGKNGTPFETPIATPGGAVPATIDIKKLTTPEQHAEARKRDPKGYLEAIRKTYGG